MTDRTSETRTVVIHDRCPAYRLGLSVALAEAGFTVLEPGRPAASEIDGALVSLGDEGSLAELGALKAVCPSVVVIALLAEPSSAAFRAAFRAGAGGAVARDSPLEQIVRSLSAALAGGALVPTDVMAALLAGAGAAPAPEIPCEQTDWLRRMARGDTVSQIATDAGYSERAMYRHLRGLYTRLGARNRTEAVLPAMQHGLLAETAAFWQHPASEPAQG